jgi:hypothetical protein
MPIWWIRSRRASLDQGDLADGEAMLSFYFGRDASFVWAVPREGSVAFAEIKERRNREQGAQREASSRRPR